MIVNNHTAINVQIVHMQQHNNVIALLIMPHFIIIITLVYVLLQNIISILCVPLVQMDYNHISNILMKI